MTATASGDRAAATPTAVAGDIPQRLTARAMGSSRSGRTGKNRPEPASTRAVDPAQPSDRARSHIDNTSGWTPAPDMLQQPPSFRAARGGQRVTRSGETRGGTGSDGRPSSPGQVPAAIDRTTSPAT